MPPPKPPSPRFSPFSSSDYTLPSLLVLLALLFLFFFLHASPPSSQNAPNHFDKSRTTPSASRHLFLSLSAGANATVSGHLRALAAGPHLAGTSAAEAATRHVLSSLRLAGIRTLASDFAPILSYPLAASLSLLRPDGALIKKLSLAEPAASGAAPAVVRPYHAYAPSGAAVAPAVYVNYGREEDYLTLERIGVAVRGCVAVARSGGGYRGGVVARAAERGAAAVLIFRDSGDGGVERGTVVLGGPGDPLTPGWAAAAGDDGGVERLRVEDEEVRRRFPGIPSMPVSAATAAEILGTLGGPPVPHGWRGEFSASGVGPGPSLVNFTYQDEKKLAMIRNVFGVITGHEEPDRYVIMGNHRDAWTYGAVDPNSGTAALLDIARRFGILLRSGWRPRRTIILCSWDAEEFGMIGSTEWVEQNLGNLGSKAVVYLNVDCAVQGPGFFASATPQLDKILVEVTKQVKDPDLEGRTVYDTWVAMNGGISIERLARVDSDFSAFLHHAGVPSLDMYYGKEFPGYHTALDSFSRMEKYGDPLFHRHVAIAEIWGLLVLHLADDLVLPFDYLSYAAQLEEHTTALIALLNGEESALPISTSIHELSAVASEVLEQAKKLQEEKTPEDSVALRRRALNDRLMLAERGFLDTEGLKGRQWFKHMIYSPPEDYESKLPFFPGVVDAISRAKKSTEKDSLLGIQHEMWRVARAIQRAANALRGELF